MKTNQGDGDDEEVKRGGSGGDRGGGRGGGNGSIRAAAPVRELTVEEEVDQIMAEKKKHAQEERENAATLDKFFSNT